MMNRRPFVLACALGLTGAFVTGYYVGGEHAVRAFMSQLLKSQKESDCPPQIVSGIEGGLFVARPTYFIVDKKDIPEGKLLEQIDLDSRCIPMQFAEPYSTIDTQEQEVVGLVTRVPIFQGQQILHSLLRQPTKDSLLPESGK